MNTHLHSMTCPRCKEQMDADEVVIYRGTTCDVLDAHCCQCGWDGTKRKPHPVDVNYELEHS